METSPKEFSQTKDKDGWTEKDRPAAELSVCDKIRARIKSF
jgi:hypothetical protein